MEKNDNFYPSFWNFYWNRQTATNIFSEILIEIVVSEALN